MMGASWGLGLLVAWVSGAWAADPAAAFRVCTACHGKDGGGDPAMRAPVIGGQEQWYVERQLKAFRAGHRGTDTRDVYGRTMAPMAKAIVDDATVTSLSVYISALTPAPGASNLGGDPERGKAAYGVCAGCHGADGRGMAATGGPALVNQYDWYIVQQLSNFRLGIRGTHAGDTFGAQMRPMASMLDEQTQKDIAAYLVSLR